MTELINRIFGVKCGTCSHRKGGFFKENVYVLRKRNNARII